jgi:hypothetical protein
LAALQMLRICLSGRPKRRKQPEHYVQYRPKISVKKIEKDVDNNFVVI